ncbi:MAG: DUF2202 domain-containing protein [Campylobacterota bacterium]|nr:DUF2202 domain-containing protein [Campylobacterota bacterium]
MDFFKSTYVLIIVLLLAGCSSGGGVVGKLLDDKSSSSNSDLNETIQNRLYIAKQLEVVSEVYGEAIDKLNSLDSNTTLNLAGKTLPELLYDFQLAESFYENKNEELIKNYSLNYSGYDSDDLTTTKLYILSAIKSGESITDLLNAVSFMEENNVKYLEEYQPDIVDLYDTLISSSKYNFGNLISEIYDRDDYYVPKVLDDTSYTQILVTDLDILGDVTADNFKTANTIEDQNITKVQTSKLTSKPLYLSDKSLQEILFYITKQEKFTNELFSRFSSDSAVSDWSDTLSAMYSAELTHFNNSSNVMVSEFNLDNEYSNYTSNSLSNIYSEINSTITSSSTESEILRALAKLEERSIYDLNASINSISNDDITELFQKLSTASNNHLKILVQLIYNIGETYTPVILDNTTYGEIIGTLAGSTTEANIKVDNYLDDNNITKTYVTKVNLNNFTLSDNVEIESLLYVGYLEKLNFTTMFVLKNYSDVFKLSGSIMKTISDAELTHSNAVEDLIKYYGLESNFDTYENEGLDNFEELVFVETPSTSGDKDILKSLMFVQERTIKDLTEHLADDVSSNGDITNLYTKLLTASKNHLKLLAEILFDPEGYNTTYTPRLLSSSDYTAFVGTLGDSPVEVMVDDSKPYIDFYSTYGDNNVTSITISELDVSKAPYVISDADESDLAYIAQQEYLWSNDILPNFAAIFSDAASSYTADNLYIKQLLTSMNSAEATHYNTIDSILDIFGVNIGTNGNLDDFADERVASIVPITSETEYITVLKSLALAQERSVCDLNSYIENGISSSEITELFDRLQKASINHLRLVINSINDAQGDYSMQLLNDTTTCGSTITSKISGIETGSVDERIDIYYYVQNDGVSEVSISEKPVGGELSLSNVSQKNSLNYIDQLMNASQLLFSTMYLNLNTPADYLPIDDVMLVGKGSHIDATSEALSIYNVTTAISTTDQDSLDAFSALINAKPVADANATIQDKNVLNVFGLIEERNILDLKDHIDNTVYDNQDIVNIYTALMNSAKNHLMVIDNILNTTFTEPYSCQLLEQTYCDEFLPYVDSTSFIKGTPTVNP